MPARLLLITLVMAACSGGGSLVPPPPLMFMLWLSRKRLASVPPVGCGGGGVGGVAATGCFCPRATLPRCLPLPFTGSGGGCGSTTGGGGGSGCFSATAGAVSTTGGLTATGTARGGFFNEIAATTTISPITTSSPMIISVVLPRPLVAASLASQPVALLTDISRGGAPGTCTPPGRFSICITSEVAGLGGACACPTPFVLACGA